MWKHAGKCSGCGRRTFMFGQCMRCLRADKLLDAREAEQAEEEEPEETAGEALPHLDDGIDEADFEKTDDDAVIPTRGGQQLMSPQDAGRGLGPTASVATGVTTRAMSLGTPGALKYEQVVFVTETTAMAVFKDPKIWTNKYGGTVRVAAWPRGNDYKLSVTSGFPHRMCIGVDEDGDRVLPVQQCCQQYREKQFTILADSWHREAKDLLNHEHRSVDDELEAFVHSSRISARTAVVPYKSNVSVRKFCKLVLRPEQLMFFHHVGTELWRIAEWVAAELIPRNLAREASEGMLFLRDEDEGRWYFEELYNIQPRTIAKKLQIDKKRQWDSRTSTSTWGLICFGNKHARRMSWIIELYHQKWMVYDRYGVVERWTQPSASSCSGGIRNRDYGLYEDPSGPGPEPEKPEEEGLKWYDDNAKKREQLREEVIAEAGDTEFNIGDSLRVTWLAEQRKDQGLAPIVKRLVEAQKKNEAQEESDGYRLGPDGVLERRVVSPIGNIHVPVVPDGQATQSLTWKRWIFLQCHVGVLGGHRNAEKTGQIIFRQAWWSSMKTDVETWFEKCMTCLKFRRCRGKQNKWR